MKFDLILIKIIRIYGEVCDVSETAFSELFLETCIPWSAVILNKFVRKNFLMRDPWIHYQPD